MSRARSLDPDARRLQLLSVARQVFAVRGYHATGVSDIIEMAGVARGTFYNYFDSKRAIFQAVLEELIVAITAAFTPIDVGRDVVPQVRANLVNLLDVLEEGGVGRILFTDAAGVDAESAEALREFYQAAESRLAGTLALGQTLGIVRPGDPPMMALLLIGMLREPSSQAWLRGMTLDRERHVDTLLEILTCGVVTASPSGSVDSHQRR